MGLDGLRRIGTLLEVSSLYETAPVGGPEQDPYLNAVALIETTLSAGDLLAALHEIEARGRPDPSGALGTADPRSRSPRL